MTDPIPLSAIEHYAYCPRQFALIHVEGQWASNAHTAHGVADHAAVDAETRKVTRDGVTTWLSLPVWNDQLGIYGVCDAVEFPTQAPVPVEYKPQQPKGSLSPAAQQLTAQALCLEAMFHLPVPHGVLFTHRTRRRTQIALDDQLRAETIHSIDRVRALLQARTLPPRVDDARCRRCSLAEICQPNARPHPLRGIFECQAEFQGW